MKTKMKKQNKKTLFSALLLLIGLVIIFGVALLLKTGNFNDQSRASYGSILIGKLISDSDTTQCVGIPLPVKGKGRYRILRDKGVCTALVVSKSLAEPLVGKRVIATGILKGPYFYVKQLTLSKSTPTPTPKRTPTPTPSTNHPPLIQTTSLPTGYVNKSYNAKVDASDIDSGDALTMTISGLPFGLKTGPCSVPVSGGKITCYISGTPIQSGFFNLKVYVSDNRGGSSSKSLPLSIITQSAKVTPTPIGPPVVVR